MPIPVASSSRPPSESSTSSSSPAASSAWSRPPGSVPRGCVRPMPAKKKPAGREGGEQVAGLPEAWEVAPEPGWVEPSLAEEFPGLSILITTLDVGPGRSPAALKQRLQALSNRFGGPQAVILRQRPIPSAYRVFFRHIGLDPDQTRTPIE